MKIELNIQNYNNEFILIRSDQLESLVSFGQELFNRRFNFIDEVIATEKEICLQLNSRFTQEDVKHIRECASNSEPIGIKYVVPICFDKGKDWSGLVAHLNCSRKLIEEKILSLNLTFVMYGFLPGFSYLKGLPKDLMIARKAVPEKYIEAGTVAIGGSYLGIYNISSPGGWYSIGNTPINLMQIDSVPLMSLAPNDKIVFKEIGASLFEELKFEKLGIVEYNNIYG